MAQQFRLFKEFVALDGAGGGSRAWRSPGMSKGWLCCHADCPAASARRHNRPEHQWCWGCARTKAAALSPPTNAALPKKTEHKAEVTAGQPTTEQLKKREARARRRATLAAAQKAKAASDPAPASPPSPLRCTVAASPSPDGTVSSTASPSQAAPSQSPTPAAAAPPARMVLPEILMAAIPLLHPMLKPISDSIAQELMPAKYDPKPPETILSDLLGGADPESVTSKRAAQEAKVVKLKAVLATLGDDGEFSTQRESFEAKLAAAEAALAKTEKGTPSPGHDLKAYRKAKATLELSMQEKRDRQAAGAVKTLERRQFRGKHINDLMQQLKLLADGLTDLDKIVDDAHRDRLAAREAHDGKVIQLFNDKIAALELAPVPNAPVPPAVPPVQAPLAEPSPPNTLALALPAGPSSSAAGGIANLDQLNTAGQQISDMTKAFAEAANKFHAEFNATHEGVDISLLPAAALPKSDEVGVYALLLNFFDGWAVNGACQPFDWQTLASK